MSVEKLDNYKRIEIINGLSIALKLLILFMVGVGRYRVCLFMALYFLIKPILVNTPWVNNIAKFFFSVVAIPLLYLDATQGQVFPVYNTNLIVFFISFALTELLSKKYVNSYIESITRGEIFSYCKRCGYENVELVRTCKECSYNKKLGDLPKESSDKRKYDPAINNKDLYASTPTKRLIEILKLEDDEKIYFNVNVPFVQGIYKNNVKYLCKNVVITNKNVHFIDYKFYHRGWCYLERLPVTQIKSIDASIKHIGISDCSLLRIESTDNNTFEIFVSMRNLDKETYIEIAHIIKNISRGHAALN